jgi:hypothetical protein
MEPGTEESGQAKRKRGWRRLMRFRLLTLPLLVSVMVVWLAWQASIVAEHKTVKTMLEQRNTGMDGLPSFTPNAQVLPWDRVMMGDETIGGIYLNTRAFSNEEICRILNAYSEVDFALLDAT